MRPRLLLPIAPASLLVVALHLAPARAADARDPVAADALFRAGRELADAKDYAKACPKFAESERLDPAAGTLINLADCYEHVGRLALAWESWHEALDLLPAGDDRLPATRERFVALDARVPRLRLHPRSPLPDGSTITRDDVDVGLGALDVALPVDPGPHVVTVRAPGHAPRRIELTLASGDRRTLDVDAGALVLAEAGAPSGMGASRPLRTMGLVTGAVGVAFVGVGLVAGAFALHDKRIVDRECPGNACTQTGDDAARAGHRWATLGTVGVVGGLGAIAAGGVLLLVAPNAAASPRGGLAPMLGADGTGLVFTRSF